MCLPERFSWQIVISDKLNLLVLELEVNTVMERHEVEKEIGGLYFFLGFCLVIAFLDRLSFVLVILFLFSFAVKTEAVFEVGLKVDGLVFRVSIKYLLWRSGCCGVQLVIILADVVSDLR